MFKGFRRKSKTGAHEGATSASVQAAMIFELLGE